MPVPGAPSRWERRSKYLPMSERSSPPNAGNPAEQPAQRHPATLIPTNRGGTSLLQPVVSEHITDDGDPLHIHYARNRWSARLALSLLYTRSNPFLCRAPGSVNAFAGSTPNARRPPAPRCKQRHSLHLSAQRAANTAAQRCIQRQSLHLSVIGYRTPGGKRLRKPPRSLPVRWSAAAV